MVLVTEPHLRYSLSAFNTCFLEYISQFLSVPVRVQVFVRTPECQFYYAFFFSAGAPFRDAAAAFGISPTPLNTTDGR